MSFDTLADTPIVQPTNDDSDSYNDNDRRRTFRKKKESPSVRGQLGQLCDSFLAPLRCCTLLSLQEIFCSFGQLVLLNHIERIASTTSRHNNQWPLFFSSSLCVVCVFCARECLFRCQLFFFRLSTMFSKQLLFEAMWYLTHPPFSFFVLATFAHTHNTHAPLLPIFFYFFFRVWPLLIKYHALSGHSLSTTFCYCTYTYHTCTHTMSNIGCNNDKILK